MKTILILGTKFYATLNQMFSVVKSFVMSAYIHSLIKLGISVLYCLAVPGVGKIPTG